MNLKKMSRLSNIYIFLLLCFLMTAVDSSAQTDYKLWLQYEKTQNNTLAAEYKSNIKGLFALGNSETIQAASKELQLGLSGLLGNPVAIQQNIDAENVLVFGSKSSLNGDILKKLIMKATLLKPLN